MITRKEIEDQITPIEFEGIHRDRYTWLSFCKTFAIIFLELMHKLVETQMAGNRR